MQRAPRVTVGLAVFNGEELIAESIESILAQTFDDFELVICDNDSSDRTGEICQHFAARDPAFATTGIRRTSAACVTRIGRTSSPVASTTSSPPTTT